MESHICVVKNKNDVTVIRLTVKKLYQKAVAPFQQTMIQLMDEGHQKIVIDLSKVEVMNSSALGVLILTWDRIKKVNGSLVVTGLSPFLQELFNRMRLDLIINIAATETEGIQMAAAGKKNPAI